MATGIFSTTRVAGEGLALAIVGAGLSALAAQRLAPLGCPVPTSVIAQRLVAGDLAGAAAQCPMVPAPVLAHAFQDAFSTLALVLAAVTTLTALVVFVFLARDAEAGASSTLAQPS